MNYKLIWYCFECGLETIEKTKSLKNIESLKNCQYCKNNDMVLYNIRGIIK